VFSVGDVVTDITALLRICVRFVVRLVGRVNPRSRCGRSQARVRFPRSLYLPVVLRSLARREVVSSAVVVVMHPSQLVDLQAGGFADFLLAFW
jgi:hypothetical protein